MTGALSSRNTDSLHQLLTRAGVSLAVATGEGGYLVLVRAEPEAVNTHFFACAAPKAIAWKPGELAVAGATRVDRYRNLAQAATRAGHGESADACYLPRSSQVTGHLDTHELGYDHDGVLWLVNTRMSCVATLAPEFSFVPRWRPPFISAYDSGDRCHLNGLGFRDGQPRYVSMLGRSDHAGGWRRDKVSGGLVMDMANQQVLADRLCMPHSPRWHRDSLWFLSAGCGQLTRAIPGQAPEVVAELPGFARGLAFIDRYALVGLSGVREGANFAGLPIMRQAQPRKCGVWVVDIESGQTVAFLEFTGEIHEVFAITVLPHRYPAIVDATHPLCANAFELGPEVLANLAPVDPLQQALEQATRLHLEGRLQDALAHYRKILQSHPQHPETGHRYGLCLVDARRWRDGIAQLGAVVAQQPDNAEAMNSLGLCWYRLADLDQAMQWFDRALQADSQFALAHFNRGLVRLKQGRYAEAWPEYDWRWKTPRFVPFQCDKPRWQGEDMRDKRLLVHSEQGNGDHIQFMRFLPLVAARCRELIYVGTESLAPLVAAMPGVSESRVAGQIDSDRFDLWCPLMSLPRWLGITLDNLPAPPRYLPLLPHVVVRKLQGRRRIGVAWAGSPTQQDDAQRSMALQLLAPLFTTPDTTWFSLQMPLSAAEAALLKQQSVMNLEAELAGYARTAALVDQLDLVISVDTAIAHVAGALGKPAWILLHHDPDWRWKPAGERSDWYPSARLFRQTRPGDWSEVVARVGAALQQFEP